MSQVVDRFLQYVSFDTQSEEGAAKQPSTDKQWELARLLKQELEELGAEQVRLSEYGYIYAEIPSNLPEDQAGKVPALGFISHMDTAPALTGCNVKPQVVKNYDGHDICLNAEKQITMRISEFPFLERYKGQDLITTDGTTLLGADDKAGVAEIMTAAAYLLSHKEIPHGKICIGFTPDEEIGMGASGFDVKGFGADFAYTVDGGDITDYEYETFNAAKATVTIHGFSIHPGTAKDKMKNAILMAGEYNALLPALEIPGHTEGYEGFFHLQEMHGTVEKADMIYIVRDHSMERFQERKAMMEKAAAEDERRYGAHTAEVELQDQYYNMHEVLKDHMEILELAEQAMKAAGIAAPTHSPIRGGTDGSVLTYMGLPCPNLPSAGHNAHGRFEYAPVESLKTGVRIIRELLSPALVESVILKKKG